MSCTPDPIFVASYWFDTLWVGSLVALLVVSILIGRDNWRHYRRDDHE